ncbi:integrator complex subunit 4 [Halyomorpha halys]|uniref:integrator complex subunit 4 n=1 Tax=Halyomorpha halys TaxID=286706 RepID=UPI0006D51B79|nr:integrator complex subunit 4 [Halyomorpha halys]
MAAHLKKRALAEYGSQVQVIEPPGKRLKLSLLKKTPQASDTVYVGLLENCKTSNEALQVLLRIPDSLQLKPEDFSSTIKKLYDHFNQQNESAVRAKILALFCTIGQMPDADVELITDYVMKLVMKETSHKVIAQGLMAVLALSKLLPPTSLTITKIFNVAKTFLKDTNHYVKRICLQLIGSLNVGDNTRLIADFIYSQDARVRCAAMETLVMLHENGEKLDVSLYSDVCAALDDDYEIVRDVVLKIVCYLGNTYAENQVKVPKSDKKSRLIDDAFAKICQAVNDLSMGVRHTAMKLLGTMLGVSMDCLTQTLDKKLMSDMRKKKSLHERSSEIVTSGEWSTGKKWADDAPKELLHKDEVSVFSNGACGAFVQGLEDEFMEVRSASVDALCALAIAHPEFAVLSLDFLVDMFNDEIEEVRIKAIDSLTSMSHHIVLREHQLETILGALEDFSIDVREGLHRMLAACVLSTKDCLQMCIESLLDNLKKYPQDKKSTWRCVKEIGRKHSDLTLPLVPKLLGIHPFFDTPEPDVEDPHYISLLILVFNAAQNCPTMLQLFEEHTVKHYSYLRVTLPALVPHLTLPESVDFLEPASTDAGAQLLWRLVESLSVARPGMIQSVLPQLDTLAKIDSSIAGPAQFITMFISCQILLGKILKDRLWCSNAATTIQGNAIKNNLTQLLSLCLKMQYLFVGLEKDELAAVKQFQLKALALHLVYIVKASNLSALALCDHFVNKVEQTQKFLMENRVVPNEFCKGVLNVMSTLEDAKPGAVARCLQPLLANVTMIQPPKPNIKVRMCHAFLNGPTTSPDAPLKFTAGLVMAVQLDAEIFGLKDPLTLRLRVHYPDHQTHFSVPAASHLRPVNDEGDYRLLTQALVSHSVWSEACYVEISLCIELSEGDMTQRAHYGVDPYLELCKPLKLYVVPKPIKRGI